MSQQQTDLISWDELIQSLKEAFSGDSVDVDHVNHVMSQYVSDPDDWKQYSNFDPHRFVKNTCDYYNNGKCLKK